MNKVLLYVPVALTRLLILGLPIVVVMTTRALSPSWAAFVSWIVGALSLCLLLCLGEWTLQGFIGLLPLVDDTTTR